MEFGNFESPKFLHYVKRKNKNNHVYPHQIIYIYHVNCFDIYVEAKKVELLLAAVPIKMG